MALRLSELTFKTQHSKLSFENTIEFYKTLYSRIVEFTGTTSDFSQLSTSDRKIMLSHNLESICILRMASNFRPELSTNLDLEPLKIFFGPSPLKIEQIFNMPWAVDQDHVSLYCKTIDGLINLPVFDENTNVLFQMIVLLNTIGLTESQLREVSKVHQMEEKCVALLLKYLKSKLGRTKAFTALHKYLDFLPILRILSDKIQRRR